MERLTADDLHCDTHFSLSFLCYLLLVLFVFNLHFDMTGGAPPLAFSLAIRRLNIRLSLSLLSSEISKLHMHDIISSLGECVPVRAL